MSGGRPGRIGGGFSTSRSRSQRPACHRGLLPSLRDPEPRPLLLPSTTWSARTATMTTSGANITVAALGRVLDRRGGRGRADDLARTWLNQTRVARKGLSMNGRRSTTDWRACPPNLNASPHRAQGRAGRDHGAREGPRARWRPSSCTSWQPSSTYPITLNSGAQDPRLRANSPASGLVPQPHAPPRSRWPSPTRRTRHLESGSSRLHLLRDRPRGRSSRTSWTPATTSDALPKLRGLADFAETYIRVPPHRVRGRDRRRAEGPRPHQTPRPTGRQGRH